MMKKNNIAYLLFALAWTVVLLYDNTPEYTEMELNPVPIFYENNREFSTLDSVIYLDDKIE